MPTKKTTKTAKKTVAKKNYTKPAPVVEPVCKCGENCRCHCHGCAHWVKHLVVWAIIFALGMVCGKMMGHGCHVKYAPKLNPVFENGCLKMDSISCPKMVEKLAKADVNGDNCVSLEEFKAIKKELKKGMPKHKALFKMHNKEPKIEIE